MTDTERVLKEMQYIPEGSIFTAHSDGACKACVEFGTIGNAGIRELFDLDSKDSYKSSRIIRDIVAAGLIKPVDPDTAPRYMRYIPFWA